MNTIRIELCPEDRARLDRIITALERHNCAGCVDNAVGIMSDAMKEFAPAVAELSATQDEPAEAPTVDIPAEEKPAEPKETATETKPVTHADAQKKVVDLSAAGKKDAVRAIVQVYAPRVSAIPEDKLAEVLAKLSELEG